MLIASLRRHLLAAGVVLALTPGLLTAAPAVPAKPQTSPAAKEAKMEVSLQMEDVPLETAVRLLSEMAGLKPVRVGNVLFVTTKANATEMRADPELTQPFQQRPGMEFMQPGIMIGPGGFP